jgi:hypothetical protein
MKPSSWRSGESSSALTAGRIVTWLQNTEKFATRSARARRSVSAVEGAVVSKPDREEHHLALRVLARDPQRIEGRVHDAHVGAARLRVEQRAVPPGTRSMSPNVVSVTSGRARARSRRRRGPSGSRRRGSRAVHEREASGR